MEFKREGRDWKNPSTDDLADFAARTKVVKKCEYLGALETWNKFYPSERIFIGFLEDINYRPRVLLKGAYGFLGVRSNFKPPNIGKKENSRGRNTLIPTDVAKLLAVRYTPELEKLAQVFGGYTSFWLHCAKKLSPGEFADEGLKTPMVLSPLWDDWRAESEADISEDPGELFMSGTLSTFDGWRDLATRTGGRD